MWTKHPLRTALALAATLALAVAPLTASARAASGQWPQASSDLKADPAIRFGVLPNGMRYAIRRQSIPAGQAALRLWIDAGSLHETDAQQGLAHFLEHMAFNGSKRVKEGEMVKILERLGLAFGADTNASTGFSQTNYRLDLPRTDAKTIDTALMLLREMASNLSIEAAAVDRERGVILSEERARATPNYRAALAQIGFQFQGQRLPTRMPIGKVEVLASAPPAQIAAFYSAYYRPERAVLVAVGDFDVAAIEAKIAQMFGDWRPVGPAGTDPDLGAVAQRGAEVRLMVDPGIRDLLQLAWVRPPEPEPDRIAQRHRDLIEYLGLAVLNRRYARITRSSNPPFLNAGAYSGDQENSAEVTVVSVTPHPGRWREAMTAAEQEQRRAVLHGVRQDELEREIEEIRASLEAAVAGAATRRPAQLAGEILRSLADDQVVTAPDEDLALFEQSVKNLNVESVSTALKNDFRGSGPLVFVASRTSVEAGESAVLAALGASMEVAVSAASARAEMSWPYEDFGGPGKVTETHRVDDMEATFVRFENGVRLTVKPTDFRDDEVLVRVNVGDGLAGLNADRPSATWAANAFVEGGLSKIDRQDMGRVLASKVVGTRFTVGEDAFVLSGTTRTSDLSTQLQILTAYLSEPGWRPAAFERIKSSGSTIHDQLESTDNGILRRDLQRLIHGGDPRFAYPSRQAIADARLEDLIADIAPALERGSVEVVIVGDVTVDEATRTIAATFGALPPRPITEPVLEAQRRIAFPAGVAQPMILTHKGRADQAIGYIAWPTGDFWADPEQAYQNAVMAEVLRLRLLEELRENQGATYSPRVDFSHSRVWSGWGYVAASAEVPPEKLEGFFSDVAKIAADLRAEAPSPDELERAKKPRVDRIERQRVTNQFWLRELSGAQTDPRRLDFIRQIIPGTERVTTAEVKRAAENFLIPDKAWKLVVRPEG